MRPPDPEDARLAELIRRGASSWRGPSGSAGAAKYARATQRRRWGYLAALSGAVAAFLMVITSLAGGPGPVRTFVDATIHPAIGTEPTPRAEPTPSSKVEPSPSPKSEPASNQGTEPGPAPKHEPTPSPEPEHSTPPEPTPTTAPKG